MQLDPSDDQVQIRDADPLTLSHRVKFAVSAPSASSKGYDHTNAVLLKVPPEVTFTPSKRKETAVTFVVV